MEVQKSQSQTERNCDGSVESQLTQSDLQIAQTRNEVEAHACELTYHEKTVEPGVQQQKPVKRSHVRRPHRLQQMKLHHPSQDRQHH